MTDPRQRFSTRADVYARYRPGYPREIVAYLAKACGLTAETAIADVGSGTGLLAKLFCENGNRVYGIEPNRQMREMGERELRDFPQFVSVDGTAEATTLPDHCVDFVTAGQAFHWFDQAKTRSEFVRILRPGGWVVLVWNERRDTATPFMVAYEQLLQKYSIDYNEVRHEKTTRTLDSFFAPSEFQFKSFPNAQVLDFAGLNGRLLSSSFMPDHGHAVFHAMIRALQEVFDTHAVEGHVTMEYETKVFSGQLG